MHRLCMQGSINALELAALQCWQACTMLTLQTQMPGMVPVIAVVL